MDIQKLLLRKQDKESKRYKRSKIEQLQSKFMMIDTNNGSPLRDSLADLLDSYVVAKNLDQTIDLGYTNISRRHERSRMTAGKYLLGNSKTDPGLPQIKQLKSRNQVKFLLEKIRETDKFRDVVSKSGNNESYRPKDKLMPTLVQRRVSNTSRTTPPKLKPSNSQLTHQITVKNSPSNNLKSKFFRVNITKCGEGN